MKQLGSVLSALSFLLISSSAQNPVMAATDADKALEVINQAIEMPARKKEEQRALFLQALQLAESAVKTSPNDPKAWWAKGDVLYCLDRKPEAEDSIKKSLELDPKFARAYSSLGQILAEQEKNDEAIAAWRKAVEVDPKYINARANIGQCNQNQGKQQESMECWQKVVSLDDADWRAWSKIVQCASALGDQDGADKAREKLFSMHNEGKIRSRRFCREQFSVSGKKVMAFEYFIPDGWENVRYEFFVLGKTDSAPPRYRYVLGEIESDTQTARQLKSIGPKEHSYCIDGFDPGGTQSLIGMMSGTESPSYDSVRKIIAEHLSKLPLKNRLRADAIVHRKKFELLFQAQAEYCNQVVKRFPCKACS